MAKRSRGISTPVARAPFHRGAYVDQYVQSKAADAWVTANDPDGGPLPALIGSPELGGRRGSNRSEITPAFTYHAVFGETDPDGPTITLASGATMLVEEYEALVAEPDIDSVSQHATTAHRDRRLMSAASMTRTRYAPPCVTRSSGSWETADRWTTTTTTGRWRTLKSGAMAWTECPVPCPATCKQDHRHTRHVHREQGTTYVTGTRPYGADGRERAGETRRESCPASGRRITLRTVTGRPLVAHVDPLAQSYSLTREAARLVPSGRSAVVRSSVAGRGHRTFLVDRERSIRQGRRTARVAIGTWTDAAYAYDPTRTTAVDAVTLPEITAVAGHNAHVGDGVAMGPATYLTERETLAVDWARVPFVPAKVRGANGRPPTTLAVGMPEATLRHRIASDPASAQLAFRVLLAAEHAWANNGQPITADQGLTLTVLPAPHGGPSLTITRDGQTVATGTYKSRRSLVRLAVASVLAS